MQSGTIKGQKREAAGRRAASRLRRSGQVPGVIYGHGEPPVSVSIDADALTETIHGGAHLVDLDLDGQASKLLVKDVQYDHMNDHIIHVDLARVSLDERVTVTVPLKFRGTPVGVKADGGNFLSPLTELEIECLVIAIPSEIRVNVAELKIDEQIQVKQLELPQGVTVLANPEQVVCLVAQPVAEEELAPAAAEGTAEPELIGRKPEEGEAEAGAEAAPEKPAKADKKE